MDIYLGIDVGSVTVKLTLLAENDQIIFSSYQRTQGRPIAALQRGLKEAAGCIPPGREICGVGVTGSARYLAAAIVGADVVKNEITAQSVATLYFYPDIRTIIEIGGQDSKLIIIRDGMVEDFAMNMVCAAGTGSFLDQQASRLDMDVADLGALALRSRAAVWISGPCTVFAESDMIHKQQIGHDTKDVVYGLCQALVRNYLNDVGKGKELLAPVVFQGGVAFNRGVVRAFEESLGVTITIPRHHEAMGAVGMSLLAREAQCAKGASPAFKGFRVSDGDYRVSSFKCDSCHKLCEIAQIRQNGEVIACWGGRCDLWEGVISGRTECI